MYTYFSHFNGKQLLFQFHFTFDFDLSGHANEELSNAITNQMKSMHHISNLYFIPQQGRLAEWLVQNSCADKVFFCNSGAEANEASIKLVRKYAHTKLGIDIPVIITAKQSFHGRTLATITATGKIATLYRINSYK